MYNASTQFHDAVMGRSVASRMMFKFADGTIFTNEDINISSGEVKVVEAVNLEGELTIGACPSSTLDATIMNYHGLLSDFEFGEAEVSLAALIKTGAIPSSEATALVRLRHDTGSPVTIEGYTDPPYVKVNGVVTDAQPPFPVHSIAVFDAVIYFIGESGEVWQATWDEGVPTKDSIVPIGDPTEWDELIGYKWEDLEDVQWNSFVGQTGFNAFMENKFRVWAKGHRGLVFDDEMQYEFYADGRAETYEHVKLGVFNVDTPTKRKINLIAISAYDRMTRFDVDADSFWQGLSFPLTLGQIFDQLCAFVGVPRVSTSFINSSLSFPSAPFQAEGITAREILRWIAEMACAFARMTRDGEVELAWFSDEPLTLPMTSYYSIEAAEYQVAQIDKLQVLNSESDIGVIIGEGDNGYQIMSNPFMNGTTDAQVRAKGVPIYNRLSTFAAFSPISARAVCNWAIQAGDVIEVELNGTAYSLPIYVQTITWRGGAAQVVYESTGAERRPAMKAVNRVQFSNKRRLAELRAGLDGVSISVSELDGDLSALSSEFALQVGSISLSVSELVEDVSDLSSEIALTAGQIELVVGSDKIVSESGQVNASVVVSAINDSSVTINANRINLSGYVTVSSLATAGQTTINGNNITTGTLNANLIKSGNIQPGAGQYLTIAGFTVSSTTLSGANISISSLNGQINFGSYGSIYPSGNNNAMIVAGQNVVIDAQVINLGTGNTAVYLNGTRLYA